MQPRPSASAIGGPPPLRGKRAHSRRIHHIVRFSLPEDLRNLAVAHVARLDGKDWPYPVIELYLGERSPAEVLSVASNPDEQCDAQFYTGEWHLLKGNRAAATIALQAAIDISPKDTFEYKVELAELKRPKL